MAKKEVHDSDGQLVGYRYEGNVANRALELLGKELGMFIDRKQVTGKDGGPLEVVTSDADLARALAAFIARTRVMQEEDGAA